MSQFFLNQSAASQKLYSQTLAQLNELDSKRVTFITGRDLKTYGYIDLDEYLTKEEAEETFLTKDDLGDAAKEAAEELIESLFYEDDESPGYFVTSVSEENGIISVSRGTITSEDESVLVTPSGSDIDLSVEISSITVGEVDDLFN